MAMFVSGGGENCTRIFSLCLSVAVAVAYLAGEVAGMCLGLAIPVLVSLVLYVVTREHYSVLPATSASDYSTTKITVLVVRCTASYNL